MASSLRWLDQMREGLRLRYRRVRTAVRALTALQDWASHTVNLATTQGRMSLPCTLPAYAAYAQGHPVTTADCSRRSVT